MLKTELIQPVCSYSTVTNIYIEPFLEYIGKLAILIAIV